MRDRIAVLTMRSWLMYNSKWAWEPWLKDRLHSPKGAAGLVIDLLQNECGNECGNAILARLSGKDIAFQGYRQLVRYRRTPKVLDPYLDTWDESFRSIGEKAPTSATASTIWPRRKRHDFCSWPPPRPSRCRPHWTHLQFRDFVICPPRAEIRAGPIVRRAERGNLRGINSNGYFFVRLPGSGLEFDIPIVGNFPQTPQPDRGVVPDALIKPTIADIAIGRDPCLRSAVIWIEMQ